MSEIINKPIGIRCADIYLRFPEIMEDECNDLAEFLEDEHIVYEGATDIFIDQKNKLNKYKKVFDKIKEKSVMYYDPEYSKIYGELCSMPGANNARTPVIVIDDEILELLEEIE